MIDIKKSLLITIWLLPSLPLITSAQVQNTEPNAAELVRAVRESENWLHHIDSLQFRVEGKWSHPPESIAARRAELKRQSPDEEPDPERNWELKPSYGDILEYAIDFKQKHLRYLVDIPGQDYRLHVWDGNLLKRYAKLGYISERYNLYLTKEMLRGIFGSLSWPRAQPHSFWWEPKNIDEDLKYFGSEEDFRITGHTEYRGVKCYVLEYQSVVAPENIHRWFVSTEEHLLYGRLEGSIEHWTLDYREVSPGCKIPMTQGYSLRRKGADYVDFQRDVKIIDVRINETLPEELFQMEFKEGLPVYDERSDKLVVYNHTATPMPLIEKPLPKITDHGIDLSPADVNNKIMLVCFFDLEQRPSRNCVMQLCKKVQELLEKDIVVVAIQTSKVEKAKLDEWIKENYIMFPLGMIKTDEKKARFTWGIKSLPWMILTDKKHIVSAEGFGIDELEEKIKEAENAKQ